MSTRARILVSGRMPGVPVVGLDSRSAARVAAEWWVGLARERLNPRTARQQFAKVERALRDTILDRLNANVELDHHAPKPLELTADALFRAMQAALLSGVPVPVGARTTVYPYAVLAVRAEGEAPQMVWSTPEGAALLARQQEAEERREAFMREHESKLERHFLYTAAFNTVDAELIERYGEHWNILTPAAPENTPPTRMYFTPKGRAFAPGGAPPEDRRAAASKPLPMPFAKKADPIPANRPAALPAKPSTQKRVSRRKRARERRRQERA